MHPNGSQKHIVAPKTLAIREHLVKLLATETQPHCRLPTERELAQQFSVTRLTVRHVLERLEFEGRIYRTQGSGTFAAEPRIAKSLELSSFTSDMEDRGLVAGSRINSVSRQPAGAHVGFNLGVSPQSDVLLVVRVRTGDSQPMCVERAHFPVELFPEIGQADLDGSLYQLLETAYGVVFDRAQQTISATVLDEEIAELLECAPFSPALFVTRAVQDVRGRRVEYAESTYRADKYSFDFTVYRPTLEDPKEVLRS